MCAQVEWQLGLIEHGFTSAPIQYRLYGRRDGNWVNQCSTVETDQRQQKDQKMTSCEHVKKMRGIDVFSENSQFLN